MRYKTAKDQKLEGILASYESVLIKRGKQLLFIDPLTLKNKGLAYGSQVKVRGKPEKTPAPEALASSESRGSRRLPSKGLEEPPPPLLPKPRLWQLRRCLFGFESTSTSLAVKVEIVTTSTQPKVVVDDASPRSEAQAEPPTVPVETPDNMASEVVYIVGFQELTPTGKGKGENA
ncbi:hypothetical protein ACFE04_013872 [Oxalis oulophora]